MKLKHKLLIFILNKKITDEKILVFLILSISLISVTNAQNVPACDTDWDWLENSRENWLYYPTWGMPGQSYEIGTSISKYVDGYINKNYSNPDLKQIVDGEDYTKEEGWELLAKNFGCGVPIDHPYFLLYNRYRGTIRLFMYGADADLSAQQAVVSLEWNTGSNKTSLLSPLNTYCYATNKYPNNVPAEKGLNSVSTYWETYWFVTDFAVTFDHTTDANASNYALFFKVSLVEVSTVDVRGEFEYVTTSYSLQGDKASKTSKNTPDGLKEFATEGKKFTEKIPSRKEMQKTVDQAASSLNTYSDKVCPNNSDKRARENLAAYLSDVSDDFEKGGELSNILLGISDIGGIAGGAFKTIVGLYDMFSGKAKSTSTGTIFQPTISHGTVSLTRGKKHCAESAKFERHNI
ncbi:hypothetical protein ACT3CD_10410 [Geofilum sp. OHC36d9]|uniref:hypothetical protein n=1 Tax=Geofilum sp. OHC36d9 TaxID=3458413 RepID=UPI00403469CF